MTFKPWVPCTARASLTQRRIASGWWDWPATMRTTVETTGRLREEDLTPELADELLAAFRGWRQATA